MPAAWTISAADGHPLGGRRDPVAGLVADRDVPHVLVGAGPAARRWGRPAAARDKSVMRSGVRAGHGRPGSQAATRCGTVCSSWSPGPKKQSSRPAGYHPWRPSSASRAGAGRSRRARAEADVHMPGSGRTTASAGRCPCRATRAAPATRAEARARAGAPPTAGSPPSPTPPAASSKTPPGALLPQGLGARARSARFSGPDWNEEGPQVSKEEP